MALFRLSLTPAAAAAAAAAAAVDGVAAVDADGVSEAERAGVVFAEEASCAAGAAGAAGVVVAVVAAAAAVIQPGGEGKTAGVSTSTPITSVQNSTRAKKSKHQHPPPFHRNIIRLHLFLSAEQGHLQDQSRCVRVRQRQQTDADPRARERTPQRVQRQACGNGT